LVFRHIGIIQILGQERRGGWTEQHLHGAASEPKGGIMLRIALVAVSALLLCASASYADTQASRRGVSPVSVHKAKAHTRTRRDVARRDTSGRSSIIRSPVCGPAYDLVFHRIVCLDPRYIY